MVLAILIGNCSHSEYQKILVIDSQKSVDQSKLRPSIDSCEIEAMWLHYTSTRITLRSSKAAYTSSLRPHTLVALGRIH